ncbi:NADH-ubiquinone/plastoquinone oxidoreductase family protein [Myxococcus stipitatus DSM 14675]|uniref:NADH-ubiquinone/plastoquinone oxidoreductase family protein n=1 Tax=Myxococcus stipitatus (strain DSM 14675 / JCM 12634 / Mx s8) TaxID=1278073 RepID=L7UNM9_MYXSD|nr:complex I subunit 5 family protein [Myxococcus stipitatus]AGC48079.1 NADH-ubiquinone/plastoquinone oxidoreductase family protein [Myxococcus stipitatus DSM 14675]
MSLAEVAVGAALLVPLVWVLAVMIPGTRAVGMWLAPWAALPALGLGLGTGATLHWKSVLLGMWLYGPETVTRTYLIFTGALWLFAGLFAKGYLREDSRRPSFWGFYLATLAGNVGAVLALDVASFYLFFAMMTFCAYGLVVHVRDERAAEAGRVYIVMALLGEVSLLAAFFLTVGTRINVMLVDVARVVSESGSRDLIVVLVLVGFGIKVGALLLHMWLPLAHPVAPAPASAVLSGAIIKVGVLGWLRFLPLGQSSLPMVSQVCVGMGLAAAFYAVVVGLTQREAKTVLAYSSVSQMGFITLAVGLALGTPEAAPMLVVAVLVYAVHHSMAKGLLFLGAGLLPATGWRGWRGGLVLAGLAWSGLEIAGAPLTSGALAKLSLKSAEAAAHGPESLPLLLSLAAVGSTLLMARFLERVVAESPEQGTSSAGWMGASWGLLFAMDTALLFWSPVGREALPRLLEAKNLVSSAWPVLVGAGVCALAWSLRRRLGWRLPRIPAGDVLWPLMRVIQPAWRLLTAGAEREPTGEGKTSERLQQGVERLQHFLLDEVDQVEARLSRLRQVGLALLVWLAVFLLLLVR